MYVCMHACVHVALRKDFAIVLQHCEKVMQWFCRIARGAILQWFVPDVPNIAETLIFSIARGVRNCFAALQKGVAMVLLHCGGVLQWLCFAALRGVLAMPLLRFLIAKGCHKGFAALRGVSAMAPVNVKYCNDVWAKRELLFGILGLNGVTCLDVRGKRRNVLHCLVNNGFYLGFDKGLAYDAVIMGSQDLQIVFSAGTQVIKCFGVWHSPCLKLGGFVTLPF